MQEVGNVLPKVYVYLRGPTKLEVLLKARNSFLGGRRIINTFEIVPDLPQSYFELNLNGGRNGILNNFDDLCKAKKKDLARFLDVHPDDKKELRRILRELEHDGALGRTGRRRYADANALPETGVMEIVDRDGDGELLARMRGDDDGLFGPLVRVAPGVVSSFPVWMVAHRDLLRQRRVRVVVDFLAELFTRNATLLSGEGMAKAGRSVAVARRAREKRRPG